MLRLIGPEWRHDATKYRRWQLFCWNRTVCKKIYYWCFYFSFNRARLHSSSVQSSSLCSCENRQFKFGWDFHVNGDDKKKLLMTLYKFKCLSNCKRIGIGWRTHGDSCISRKYFAFFNEKSMLCIKSFRFYIIWYSIWAIQEM